MRKLSWLLLAVGLAACAPQPNGQPVVTFNQKSVVTAIIIANSGAQTAYRVAVVNVPSLATNNALAAGLNALDAVAQTAATAPNVTDIGTGVDVAINLVNSAVAALPEDLLTSKLKSELMAAEVALKAAAALTSTVVKQ